MLGSSRGLAGTAIRVLLPLGLVAAALISTHPAGAATGQDAVNTSAAPTCSSSTPITFGAPPSSGVVSDPSGPAVCFTFDADDGDSVVIDAISTSDSAEPTVTLVDPNGNVVSPNQFGPGYSLETSGTYTIGVAASADGSFNVSVQRTDDPVNCTTVTLGTPAFDASISEPGQMLCFDYDVSYPEMVVAHIQSEPTYLGLSDFYPSGSFSGGYAEIGSPATVGAPGNALGSPTMLIYAYDGSPATGSIELRFASLDLSSWGGKPGAKEKMVAEHFPKGETLTFSYMTGLRNPTSQVICKAPVTKNGQPSCMGYIPQKKDAGALGYHLIEASGPKGSHVAVADFLLK